MARPVNEIIDSLRVGASASTAFQTLMTEAADALDEIADRKAAPSPADRLPPLFWYRPVGVDGGYEGPLHAFSTAFAAISANTRDQWKPLYTVAPSPQNHVVVKPLEWTVGDWEFTAQTPFGHYVARESRDQWIMTGLAGGVHNSIEAFQRAANADFEERVRACLNPSPQPNVRVSRSTSALVEQAGEILANYGLIPHPWDEAGREAREVAISEIIVLARTPSPEARVDGNTELAEAASWLLCRVSGKVLRDAGYVLSDTSDLNEFMAARAAALVSIDCGLETPNTKETSDEV